MESVERRAELHVEVLLKPDDGEVTDDSEYVPKSTVEARVLEWLLQSFAGFFVDTYIDMPTDGSLQHARLIQSIRVVDFSGPARIDAFHEIDEVTVIVHAYQLCAPSDLVVVRRQPQQGVQERVLALPSKLLAGTWESLMFETIDPRQILKSIARIIVLMKQPGLDVHALSLNRLVLLHGPPGCGKTTLCRALAQKLSIRLSTHFPDGKLFEINTQSLLSKYYSESGRLVSEMFEKIIIHARSKDTLVCVLIDEVESIAGSREQLNESGECHDSIRATNQLLTALDRIRDQPNVIVFCTSNLKQAIDPAFLDRVDYEVAIPPPCTSAIYEILRSTVNELIRCRLVIPEPCVVPDSALPDMRDRVFIPEYNKLIYLESYPGCPARVVAALAKLCRGYSGRKLRKMPLLAITTYTWGETCPLGDALAALRQAVEADASLNEDVAMR